ncbi:MAG TPA: enolase C-terminal domain-like protein [Candidatus Nanoarchaeia archaeon]
MGKIARITSEEILDSSGVPTLKTTVYLDDNTQGTASIPSGTSIGTNEAVELRDGDPNRYNGRGVLQAINNVQGIIFQAIKGMDPTEQEKIDNTMLLADRTGNKSKLGANAILSVSLAVAVAAATSQKIPLFKHIRMISGKNLEEGSQLPQPVVNLIEGGRHVESGLEFQEFLAIPKGSRFIEQGYAKTLKLIESLKALVKQKKLGEQLGVEGGFAVDLPTNEAAINLIKEAMANLELTGADFNLGLDVAAMSIYKNGEYRFRDVEKSLNDTGFINYLQKMAKKHQLYYLEDPLSESDWSGWRELTRSLSPSVHVIGDDLTATNQNRLTQALENEAITGVVVKPNQIGTLTETLAFTSRAQVAGIKVVVSHRSGETEDSFIVDLAVAVNADLIKIGSPLQKVRFAKYNRLLEIEKELWRHK